jgi:2-polyprenyl-3-methyl-5-hydroxy-6-metoxy-1,4-benzoquinol methylase
MPTSFLDNIPTIVRIVQRLEPARVLDVGIGHGKYGLLTREYLSGDTGRSDVVIDGVEGFSGYVGEIQRAIYDQVLLADIRELDFAALEYELYLMIDVLEHVAKDEGHRILQAMAGTVLVSTPKEDYRAHYAHNPLEDHQSHWGLDDFVRYPLHDFSNDNATIVVLDTRGAGAGP